jgi:LuxR family quorum-sensing system transcriptional regulator CciR
LPVSIVNDLRAASRQNGLGVVQDFVTQASGTKDMVALRTLIEEACLALDFDYFALVNHIRFGHPSAGHVRLSNYPLDWLAVVRERDQRLDPVLRAAERASSGFTWDRIESMMKLTDEDRALLREARDYGMGDGFTVPNHVPGEIFGSSHFAVREGRPFPAGSVPAAQALGNFAFEAARRLLAERTIRSEEYVVPAPLSDRQRECLLFVARGKSDSVIAQLLSIRPKTVNEHIEAAKRRYAVASRSQLLVRALFRSEICFCEVID